MTEHLTLEVPFEVRSESDDGRTLEGRIVPFGEAVTVNGQQEAFAPGVFDGTNAEDVVLLYQHDQTRPVGRMVELRQEEDGYHASFRLADTRDAQEASSLARDRIARGLSVGFVSESATRKDGVRTHTKARLMETSLVTFPAYRGAQVLAVREEGGRMEETATPVVETPDPFEAMVAEMRAESERQFRELRNDLANVTISGRSEAEPTIVEVRAAYAEMLRMVAENPAENRALADVIGTGSGNAEGLLYNQYVAELLGFIDDRRPLFSAAGTVGFPSSGYGLVFPRKTQSTLVQKRSGEKTEIASRELTVAQGSYMAEWFAGGVDIALELIAQSDPSVLAVVADDLLSQYAIATETEFATDAVAAATAGGVLDTSDWAAFVAAMVAASAAVRTATGAPGDRLALTDESWGAIVGMLNPSQPSISFGAGPDFAAESVNVGGISVFHAPELTQDLMFNVRSLRKSERPPVQVSATNVALMGRDVGILGATIFLPLYPAGILKFTAS